MMSRSLNATRGVRSLATSVALTAASMLVLSPTAGAIPGNPVRPSSQLWTPLSGTVSDQATSESVTIQSNLHLVWRPDGSGDGGNLQGNVADSSATGVVSGDRYSFTGADTVTISSDPIAPINLQFRLANGPSIRVTVAVQLTFSESGALTGATAEFTRHSF